MTRLTAVEVIAGVYITGAHLCIRDDAELGILATRTQYESIVATGLYGALGEHADEIRATVLEGIHQTLDGYLPALDGLGRHELTGDVLEETT